jgi:Lrp/AsnC family transcriptional regulator, leucine-responsive regulatory protein
MPDRLDDIDLHLLELLQAHGRTSQQDLAHAVGLSSPAVGERIRKLEDRGVIRGYAAIVEPRRVGRDVTAYIFVGIAGSGYYEGFRALVLEHSEVLECHSITGQGSHLLKVRTESTSSLEALLAAIQSWPGVQWTTTSIVLSTMKETAALALAPHRARSDGTEARPMQAEEPTDGDRTAPPPTVPR